MQPALTLIAAGGRLVLGDPMHKLRRTILLAMGTAAGPLAIALTVFAMVTRNASFEMCAPVICCPSLLAIVCFVGLRKMLKKSPPRTPVSNWRDPSPEELKELKRK